MTKKTLRFQVGIILMALVVSIMIPLSASGAQNNAKTIKLGVVANLGWALGVDFKKVLDVIVPLYNEKGGLVINGERYDFKIIFYDSKLNPEVGRAAVERLVYQDKVKFILGDETVDAWLPVTEQNKVLAIVTTPSPAIFNPEYKYVFNSTFLNTRPPAMWGWFAQTHPDVKSWSGVYFDNMLGHILAGQCKKLAETFGQKTKSVTFVPPETSDFGAVATKLRLSNPDMVVMLGAGEVPFANLAKSLHEAGWKGIHFAYVGVMIDMVSEIIPLSIIEGMITSEDAVRLDSPPLPAKQLKDAYVEKRGSWDNPSTMFVNNWYLFKAALEKAQSLDVEKIASMIGKGMRWEATEGMSMLVPRKDMGNERACDAVLPSYVRRLEGGKMKLIHTISPEEAFKSCEKFYGWK